MVRYQLWIWHLFCFPAEIYTVAFIQPGGSDSTDKFFYMLETIVLEKLTEEKTSLTKEIKSSPRIRLKPYYYVRLDCYIVD